MRQQHAATVPELLRQLTLAGMTQMDIAREAGLSSSEQVNRWMRRAKPQMPSTKDSIDALWRICEPRGFTQSQFCDLIINTHVVNARETAEEYLQDAGMLASDPRR